MTPDSSVETRPNGGAMPRQLSAPYVAMLNAALAIASVRALTLLTLTGSIGMWGFTVAYPEQLRIVAAGLYSGLVMIPMIWALARKG